MKTTEFWVGLVTGVLFGSGVSIIVFAVTFMYFLEKFLLLVG